MAHIVIRHRFTGKVLFDGDTANLYGVNLRGADLRGTDLRGADLEGANLEGADLLGAHLEGADLPPTLIVPETGSFIGNKKLKNGKVVRVLIPDHAYRTNAITSRKCRASALLPLDFCGTEGNTGPNNPGTTYEQGRVSVAHNFDSDRRVECTRGLHFFMTRTEAEEWGN